MILIIGLGNPGRKYQKTRHNVGSRVINELESLNLENVVLVKPTASMNESGRAVKSFIKKEKILTSNLWVIHDDIDLPLGRIRIVKNRGAAGHKGVESIIKELRTKNFIRSRIGICPKTGKPRSPEKFVLQKFTKSEEKIIKETIKKTAEAIVFFLKGGLGRTMNRFNN